MSEPRNVTPGTAGDPGPTAATGGSDRSDRSDRSGWPGADFRWRAGSGGRDGAPEWTAWQWARGGRGFPWGGVVLVVLGGALLLQEVIPGLNFSTIILLGLGLAFLVAWLLGRSRFAATPAFILLGLGIAPLLRDLGYVRGSGWTALTLGAALALLWLVGEVTKQPHRWALWVGGILLLIGLAQVSDQIPGLPPIGSLWPIILILIGLAVIFGGRFDRGRPAP